MSTVATVATPRLEVPREAACRCSHALGRHERLAWDGDGLGTYGPRYGHCGEPDCACSRWELDRFREVMR